MTRFTNIFFAPLLRPMLALLLWAYTHLADSPLMAGVTQWFCALKAVLYGVMGVVLVYGAVTLPPAAAKVPTEVAQLLVLVGAYVFGALSVAHYRLAQHFRDAWTTR